MEVYFRKKGQEFESQKKKLTEANNWILQAERKLKASEEERLRLQRDVEELQIKLQWVLDFFENFINLEN